MYVVFGFKEIGEPILLQVAPQTISLYCECRAKRISGIILYAILSLIYIFLYFISYFNFISILSDTRIQLLHLILACLFISLLTFYLFWRKPRACLLYSCLNTQIIESYLQTTIENLYCKLERRNAHVLLIDDRRAKEIHKTICCAQKLIDLSKSIKETEVTEAVDIITSSGNFDEFYTIIQKYK